MPFVDSSAAGGPQPGMQASSKGLGFRPHRTTQSQDSPLTAR
jgi:hypothetical protein